MSDLIGYDGSRRALPAPMPVADLRAILRYSPDTGGFTWVIDRGRRGKAGALAGTINKRGYVIIKINYQLYKAHRLAWYLGHGEWPAPDMEIDHINRIKGDNRLCNLRMVSKSINLRNQPLRPAKADLATTAIRVRRFAIHPAPMPIEDLRKLIAYDRDTGILTWLDCRVGGQGAKRVRPGTVIGCRNAFGYIVVRIDKVLYQVSRIAWYLATGEWPDGEIDHRNNIRDDNRFENLRVATGSENKANRASSRPNTSGYRGVTKLRNGWVGRIMIDGRLISLPFRATAEEAHADYVEAARRKYGEFARFHI